MNTWRRLTESINTPLVRLSAVAENENCTKIATNKPLEKANMTVDT
jgi:hypothetical protein